jgi:hypothetical protein
MMENVLLDLLVKVVTALVLAAIPPLAVILVRIAFLKMQQISNKSDWGTDAFWMLNDFVKTSILAAEQMFEEDGEKFNYAVDALLSFADTFKFPLTEDQAKALIEGTLKSVKQGAVMPPAAGSITITGATEEFEI